VNNRGRPVKKWKIADLKQHPAQQHLFDDLAEGQLNELAADMEANGQREPIEILHDGTVIDGHQRWHAALKLGWTEVDVVVRHDLEFAGPEAVERHMIEANLNRRQMDPLAIARLYKRLRQLDRHCRRDVFSLASRGDVRDRLAKRIGAKSGRTLDRYVQLLDAPLAVQRCVSRGELPMQAALKTLRLTVKQQEAIVTAIEAGQPAKQVVAHHFPSARTALRKARPSTGGTIEIPGVSGELESSVADLRSALLEMIRSDVPRARKLAALDEATEVFRAILIEHEQWLNENDEPADLDDDEE